MKNRNKIISLILTISMIIITLPARIALATDDDISTYIEYADTLADVREGYSGHIFRLEKVDDETAYDYSLTVSAYNMEAFSFLSALKFDNDVVDLVEKNGKYNYDPNEDGNDVASYVTFGTLTDKMASNTRLIGADIVGNLFGSMTASDGTQKITQETGSNVFDIYSNFAVNTMSEADAAKYKTDSGAEIKFLTTTSGTTITYYTMPTDTVCDLYTLHFKLKDGQEITSDTFGIYYEDTDDFHGGLALMMDEEKHAVKNSEGVCLVGFVKPEVADQQVSFTVQNTSNGNLTGATINIYSDSAKSNLVKALTTTDGAASATLAANSTYYYTVSLSGYQDATGTFSVQATEVSVPTITLTKTSELTYDTTITVTDADTGAPLSGATVYIDSSAVDGTTDSSGQITTQLTAKSYSVSASLDGYQTSSPVSVTVKASGTNAAAVSLVPERAQVTLPSVIDNHSAAVSNASMTITKTSANSTNQWGTSKTYSAGADVELPKNTEYSVAVSAAGYIGTTVYLVIDENGDAAYYSDEGHTARLDTSGGITITKLSDPYYKVVVTQDTTDTSKFTAEVTLNNIAGTYGTFGIKYDKNVFDFGSFNLESTSEIALYNPDNSAPESGNVTVRDGDSENIGYHVFSWKAAGADSGEPFDALYESKPVATYTFTLKDGKTVKDITSDAFSVMPYDKTSAGIAYIAGCDGDIEAANEFFKGLWRYTDEENDEDNPKTGRLEASKATLGGFYQVFVNSTDETEDASCMYDVMTNVEYKNFEAAKTALNFVVTDEDNVALDGAAIKLYDAEENYLTELTTDTTGIASYAVSAGDYEYTVSRLGYWDSPETGMNTVTVADKVTASEYVTLEQKIYHETVLQDKDGNEIAETDATLSGDVYAYNGRDYHFNIKPAAGKKLEGDVEFKAVVNKVTYSVTYDDASNTYVLDKQYVTGDPTSGAEPDENGFPSDDIIIKMVKGSIVASDDTYTVTAHAGTNGTVAYDKGESSYEADTGYTDSVITVSNVKPTESVGTFTFTADTGYMVEKVVVNGVQINDYDDLPTFDYTFSNITTDNDISVTFWDGKTPSTDAIVTLVVGPNGTANVTEPSVDSVSGSTTKTYLYTEAGTLEFKLTADTGYNVVSVEKSVNGGANETVTADTSETYSVAVTEGDKTTVYVKFDTSTIFVNAYVKSGEGTISPVGVLIMNMYDSPEFVMTAKDGDWSASAVDVNGTEIANSVANNLTFTYTVPSITEDTSVGAIFTETSYSVTGYVDLSQGKNLTSLAVQSPAIVTCTRESDGMVVTVSTTTARKDASFTAELPKGTWDIQVSKVGYINYTITGFTVDGKTNKLTFGEKSDDSVQSVTPYIGNTSGTGKTVSLTDAGVVSNGLRTAASDAVKAKADVDDDGNVSATADMMYIKYNYGQRAVTQTYDAFLGE